MSAGLDNFAPRVGGVFRLNEKTVFRSGYGITYNAQAWARAVRGDNDYPVTIAGTFQNAEQFLPYGTLQQGIPFMAGPDLSSGRVPLDRSAAEYTPEIDNIDRGYIHTWNVAFERRLPYDVSVDVAYVGAKGVGGYAGLDINAPTTLGGGDASRPYSRDGPHPADLVVGRPAAHQVPVAAGRAEQALHQGVHVQGRLHAEQGDELRHGRGRPRHPDVEHAERAGAQLVARGLRPPAQLPDGLRLGAAVAER